MAIYTEVRHILEQNKVTEKKRKIIPVSKVLGKKFLGRQAMLSPPDSSPLSSSDSSCPDRFTSRAIVWAWITNTGDTQYSSIFYLVYMLGPDCSWHSPAWGQFNSVIM